MAHFPRRFDAVVMASDVVFVARSMAEYAAGRFCAVPQGVLATLAAKREPAIIAPC